jgi:hypothetical protein
MLRSRETHNKKRLRAAAIVLTYGHYVAYAHPPGLCGGDERSGGRLGKMIRRKSEIVRLKNERDFPHLVELALPPEGFRSVFLEIHRDHCIPVRRGRSRQEVKPFYIRFCFPDAPTADAFRNRFGGECLTYRGSRMHRR